MNEEDIFHEALAKDTPEERAAYLDEACAGNPPLRASVEALLQANAGASGFLAKAPVVLTETSEAPPGAAAEEGSERHPHREHPGAMVGPYKLLEQIGEGGMGTVWMAQQTNPVKRLVCVKLIKPGMDSKAVLARFEAERQALALMDHPNIAKVLDAGATPGEPSCDNAGRPYFVMELVKGVPITKYCDEHHLTPRQRLELLVPVCQAIQHAHQKGIIHRDIKPSNVLVALYDDRPVPKVIDFGVAKATGQQLTEQTLQTGFGAVVGTIEYMSPEQASFNQLDVDTRSDVYSLGVLLYELLTGGPPFGRKELEKAGVLEMLRVIREQEPPKPSTRLSTTDGLPALAANRGTEPAKLTRLVQGELDWIVMKALEKDRGRRYETANGLALDLQRYLADEAVQACPPSVGYRLRKFVRRNKGPVLAASLVVLALIGGMIGTTIGLIRAEEAHRAEAEQRRAAHNKEQKALESAAAEKKATQAALAREAEARAHRLAWQSTATLPANPGLALLLAIESAERGGPSLTSHNTLLAALAECREVRTLLVRQAAGPFQPWNFAVTSASISPDGTRLVTTARGVERRLGLYGKPAWSFDLTVGLAQVWASDGRLLATVKAPPGQTFADAQLSPDGRFLAGWFANSPLISSGTGEDRRKWQQWLYSDRVVRIWDIRTGKEVHILSGHRAKVGAVGFSPDSRRLFTASWDNTLRVWDLNTGRVLKVISTGPAGFEAAGFAPDGRRIVTVSSTIERTITYPDESRQEPSPVKVDPPIAEEPAIVEIRDTNPYHGYRSLSMTATAQLPVLGEVKLRDGPRPGVRLWDTDSGKEVRGPAPAAKEPDGVAPTCVVVSTDGRRVFAGTSQGTVSVLSADDGKPLLRFSGQSGPIRSLAVSRDGRRLLLIGENGNLAVHDAATGKELRTWPAPTQGVRTAFFNSDGRQVFVVRGKPPHREEPGPTRQEGGTSAYTPQTRSVAILDVATGNEVGQLKGHEDDVTAASLSPDGRHVVTASLEGTARVWHAEEAPGYGTVIRSAGPAAAALFSPDGRRLLVAHARAYAQEDWDSFASVWEVDTGKRVAVLRGQDRPGASIHIRKGLGGVSLAQFSPDGKRVLTVSGDRFVGVIKPDTPGNVLFTTSEEKWPFAEELLPTPVRVWDVATGRELLALRGSKCSVDWASFSPDGRRILTFSGQRRWNYHYFQVKDGKTTVSSTGGSLVNDPNMPVAHVWDAGNGKHLQTIRDRLNPTNDWSGGVAWSPDSRSIAAGHLFGFLDLEAGKWVQIPGIWSNSALSFSPDGRYLLARSNAEATVVDLTTLDTPQGWQSEQIELGTLGSDDKMRITTATRVDYRSAKNVHLTGHGGPLIAAVFSPDSRWVVTTSEDRTARLWEVQSAKLCHVLQGHLRRVSGAAFSPDGRWVVTASDDHTARIWDTASGKEFFTLTGHQGPVRTAAFSPDGRHVLTASDDGTARLWPVDPLPGAVQRKPRLLTAEERQRYAIDVPGER
jgi:WD40 repeat protein/serine/threonine protein kinase